MSFISDMIMTILSEVCAVSIERQPNRNGAGNTVKGAVLQGIVHSLKKKMGETAGKIDKTANG